MKLVTIFVGLAYGALPPLRRSKRIVDGRVRTNRELAYHVSMT